MKKLAILLIALALGSCINQNRVAKWIKNHGGEVKETVTTVVTKMVVDTVYIKGDTATFVDYVHGDIDTTITEGRVEIRYRYVTDTVDGPKVYITGICIPETTYVHRVDTMEINTTTSVTVEEKHGWLWWLNKIFAWSWLWVLMALLLYVSFKIIKSRFKF